MGGGRTRGLTLHDARHTFASLMIAANVNAKALSSFMGHSSVVVTKDVYTTLTSSAAQSAAALVDDLFA